MSKTFFDFISTRNKIEKIGDMAFKSTSIESIEFPKSVKEIGIGAFNHCQKLTSISISEDIRKMLIKLHALKDTKIKSYNLSLTVNDFQASVLNEIFHIKRQT